MNAKYSPLFPFLKYVKPIWYLNLQRPSDVVYFPDYDGLNPQQQGLIDWDDTYSSPAISKMDAAYQAWHRGINLLNPATNTEVEWCKPDVHDNYRFIRKYFHPFWGYFVLLIRVLGLYNPFTEFQALWSQRKTKRIDLANRVEDYLLEISQFDSKLVDDQPLVSVIIPTLNRYEYLKDALLDLELQNYRNFEVIVVDQSEPYNPDFYRQFNLNIQLIRQVEKSLWLARNNAIQQSKGEFIAMFEDDVRANKDWLSNHLKCLDYFNADISAGVFFPAGASIPKSRNFFRWADQFATGNACLKKEVFRRIGLFDRQFEKMRMGDGAFGLRAYLKGFRSVSNPLAFCEDIKAPVGGLRQMGSWDAFRPKSWLDPRPIPSVLYYSRFFFGSKATLLLSIANVPMSMVPYHLKSKPYLILFYLPLFLALIPLVIYQFCKSWKISSKMLAKGPLIPLLD